ncbi:hypothetical protein GTU79_04615 [Sodalis ligni]|uniref:hypothetical protein n=1 Tax=Sodalis ligni TaxID=2697027 RepID=UPI001BDE76A9|nr:hypothetical protein [Sodalis ligni]QWA12059.1 hypothetical protein GTU79_04615 [Sodalis ligni]
MGGGSGGVHCRTEVALLVTAGKSYVHCRTGSYRLNEMDPQKSEKVDIRIN